MPRTPNELHDLGLLRAEQDTAAISDRDIALHTQLPTAALVRPGRAPRGLEAQVFEWNTFLFTAEDEEGKRDKVKADLHEGVLHRANRAARQGVDMDGGMNGGMNGRGSFGGRGGGMNGGGRGHGGMNGGRGGHGGMNGSGRGGFAGQGAGRNPGTGRGRGVIRGGRGGGRQDPGQGQYGFPDPLCAGRKPEGRIPPLAKGFAEELDKDMFWDGPIVNGEEELTSQMRRLAVDEDKDLTSRLGHLMV